MNELQLFNFEHLPVRTVDIDGETYFVGKDVAEILGYTRASKAIQDHIDNEDKRAVPIQDSIGRYQSATVINESGLYTLTIDAARQSNNAQIKETAKKFKRFITNEVLPTIRKTGAYQAKPLTVQEQIQLVARGTTELDERITALEEERLVRPGESKHIKDLVGKVVRETRNKYFYDYKDDWKAINKQLFPTIWTNFKRYFDIPNYQSLPLNRYEEAVSYLEKWQPGTDIIEDVKKKIAKSQYEVI